MWGQCWPLQSLRASVGFTDASEGGEKGKNRGRKDVRSQMEEKGKCEQGARTRNWNEEPVITDCSSSLFIYSHRNAALHRLWI